MPWVLALLVACDIDADTFGGGGEEGTPTGGGSAGGGNGDGGGSGSDDTAVTDCADGDLEWVTEPENQLGTTPFYAGDSITFWGYVKNPCATSLSLVLESTCLFDVITLHPPNGASTQQALAPGCSTTTETVEIGPYDLEVQAYTWGPLYVAGLYAYSMQATTPDDRVLSGSFAIE